MKPLWEQSWFVKTIKFLRKCKWFDTYIYGKSINMEDFVRNPAEVLRDNCFPFAIKNVNPKSLLLVRLGYIPFDSSRLIEYYESLSDYLGGDVPDSVIGTYQKLDLGKNGISFSLGGKQHDILIWNKWTTKYPNAALMFQIAISIKKWVIIPYVSMNIRYSVDRYFQFGLGWGPQFRLCNDVTVWDAVLSAKLRFASFLNELKWNPRAEVFGYWEGTI